MPRELATSLLRTVYGFSPEVYGSETNRIEFSIHPVRVGYRRSHTLLWEVENDNSTELTTTVSWPNRFSRFIGDKVFGLLIAHLLELPVPATTVIPRNVAPFRFGQPTGTGEFWMRTCPSEQQPGRFSTTYGWQDPYSVMAREDPNGSVIVSIIAQESVESLYSGATLPGNDSSQDFVEGVAGTGDQFMLGSQSPERLPSRVIDDVRDVARRARQYVGPVRLEFAHDGETAWVLQLHLSTQGYQTATMSPGTPENGWLDFGPADGLHRLNELIVRAHREGKGIRVLEPVGLTSHVGDLVRRARIPARLWYRALD